MAPEQYGYQLLPSDENENEAPAAPADDADISEEATASRPVVRLQHVKTLEDISHEHVPTRTVNYDGGVRYDLSVDPWVIHPHHPAVQVWSAFISGLLLVDVAYLPIETAFGHSFPQMFILSFNFLSTTAFTLDICLQFFLQVPSPTGDFWIFNHKRIVRTYLTGYFLVDLISVIPFCEVYAMASFHSEQRVYISQLLQFLRFLRMLRFRHVIAKYQYDVDLSYFTRTVLFSGCIMLICVHMMSCVWSTLGNYQDGKDWLTNLVSVKMDSVGYAADTDVSGENPLHTYFIATYFALYTLTGIGYGDIVPTTAAEYFFVIGMMLLGSLVWATIIGEIVSVIQHANMAENNHQEKMDAVLEMSKEYGFSSDLRLRLQAYFRQLRAVSRTTFLQQIVARMNSELAIQFVHVIHDGWLKNIWWLRRLSKSTFVVQLSLEFLPLLYCPRECIVTADRLYVIQRGLCIHGRQVLSKDMCWGTDMLLTQDHLRVNRVTLAISYCHVQYLTKEALDFTLARFPAEQEVVRRAYRLLVVLRGVVWRAKQIKAEQLRQSRGSRSSLGSRQSRGSVTRRNCGHDEYEVPAHGDVDQAIRETRNRLESLEEEVDRRLERVESQVTEALSIISSAVQAKQNRGGWMPMPSRRSR